MITAIWTKICAWLGADTVGVLLKIILQKTVAKAASKIIDQVKSKENQQKAYEFVKELNANTEMSNSEKVKAFNKKMAEWAKDVAKTTLSDSAINLLRELAVVAIKAELNK